MLTHLRLRRALFAMLLCACLASPTFAELYDRGHGMIYDSSTYITWLQDANYARTSGFESDGKMNLLWARSFANNLVYAGFDDWILPCVHPSNYEFDVDTLVKVTLLNPWNGATPLPNPGPFINFDTLAGYWHLGSGAWSGQTWYWIYDDPWQSHGHYSGDYNGNYIPWCMRIGDVAGMIPADYDKSLYGGSFDNFQGWDVTGGGSAEIVNRSGEDMAKLITGSSVNLKQLLDTPDSNFFLSYDVDMSETWGQDLYVYLNGTLIDTVYNTTSGKVSRQIEITNPALMGLSEVELRFTLDYSSSGYVAYIDNIELVPEPATLAVLALGGLALLRRRKK